MFLLLLKEKLKRFDLFKRPVLLNLDQDPFLSTWLGIILSILIYSYLLYAFFVSDMFEKKNPLIYDQTIIVRDRPTLEFNHPLPLYVVDFYGKVVEDPSIFRIVSKIIGLKTIDPNEGKVPLFGEIKELGRCSDQNVSALELEKIGLTSSLCLKNTSNTLSGYWDEKDLIYIHAYLERCDNETSQVPCKSDEEIDEFLKDKNFGIITPNSYLDLNEYEQPLKIKQRADYLQTDPNIQKTTYIFMKRVDFVDDKGYIFEENKIKSSFAFDYKETDQLNKFRTKIINEIFLHSSSNIQKKTRIYQKVPNLLAQIGGQTNALLIIGMSLTQLHCFVAVTLKLMNNLYNFQKVSGKNEKKHRKAKNSFSGFSQEKISRESSGRISRLGRGSKAFVERKGSVLKNKLPDFEAQTMELLNSANTKTKRTTKNFLDNFGYLNDNGEHFIDFKTEKKNKGLSYVIDGKEMSGN